LVFGAAVGRLLRSAAVRFSATYPYSTMYTDFFVNILFPPVCLTCRKDIERGVICDNCLASIELRTGPPRFDSALPYILGAAGHYENPALQSLIHHLKFRSIRGAAEPLAELMVRYASEVMLPANSFSENTSLNLAEFVVIPIPLSRRRLRMRGYNQTELIARKFAAKLKNITGIDLPVATDILIRAKHTAPQSETTSEVERQENIRGAFAIADSPAAREAIRSAHGNSAHSDGANILLIDDVCTTGSTFLEASLALKAAGAKTILALAAAKT
jgi:ComF family protein